jgi:hypothetical protein
MSYIRYKILDLVFLKKLTAVKLYEPIELLNFMLRFIVSYCDLLGFIFVVSLFISKNMYTYLLQNYDELVIINNYIHARQRSGDSYVDLQRPAAGHALCH